MGDCSAQEADGGDGFLIVEDFDVDEPGRVVDADVDVLPAEAVGPPPETRPVTRWPGLPIRPSFFTSTWTSSPGRFFS